MSGGVADGLVEGPLEVLPWLREQFPGIPQPRPGMPAGDVARLLSAVKARRMELELEMRRVGLVEEFLEQHLADAHSRSLAGAFGVPPQPLGASPRGGSPGPVSSPASTGQGSATGSIVPRRLSLASSAPSSPRVPLGPASGTPRGAAASVAGRSRSRRDILSSISEPPPGFSPLLVSTWPATAPTDWCRACWPEVRNMRHNRSHDCGMAGRRCRLGPSAPDRLPELLFGQRWRPVAEGALVAADVGAGASAPAEPLASGTVAASAPGTMGLAIAGADASAVEEPSAIEAAASSSQRAPSAEEATGEAESAAVSGPGVAFATPVDDDGMPDLFADSF